MRGAEKKKNRTTADRARAETLGEVKMVKCKKGGDRKWREEKRWAGRMASRGKRRAGDGEVRTRRREQQERRTLDKKQEHWGKKWKGKKSWMKKRGDARQQGSNGSSDGCGLEDGEAHGETAMVELDVEQ